MNIKSWILLIICIYWLVDLQAQESPNNPMGPNPEYLLWHKTQKEKRNVKKSTPRERPQQPPIVSRPKRDILIGIAVTGNGYYGDLNVADGGIFNSDFLAFNPGIDLSLGRDAERWILPEFHVGYGKFVSQNSDIRPVLVEQADHDTLIRPNSYAETTFLYGDFNLRINLIKRWNLFRPYVSAGIGGLAFFPRAKDGVLLFRKRSTRAPGEPNYGTLSASFPVSAGVDLHLSRFLSVNMAYVYRFNSTDYLDNIGQLGTLDGNDQLHIFRVGILFRIFDATKYESRLN